MIIGVPKETKTDEYRVALLPVGAQLLCRDGHTVLVEQEAGLGSGFDDEQYSAAGAQIVETAERIYAQAEMIVKVKEPQPAELNLIRPSQIVFTYFHFAADRPLVDAMLDSGVVTYVEVQVLHFLERSPIAPVEHAVLLHIECARRDAPLMLRHHKAQVAPKTPGHQLKKMLVEI